MAIRASKLDYKHLATYLCEGIAWSRLRDIGTLSPEQGGLGLFRDGSPARKRIFGNSPSGIVDNRPDTDLQCLQFLSGKEHILYNLMAKDLEQRDLSADTKASIINLGSVNLRIRRRILSELLYKCMFLYFYKTKHICVASDTTWDKAMANAIENIVDLGQS